MTQEDIDPKNITAEEKQLLLKDLCARLPYGVIVDYKENEFEVPHWKITNIYPDTFDGWIGYNKRVGAGSESGSRPFKIGEVKPYLRPMSSMTLVERIELKAITKGAIQTIGLEDIVVTTDKGFDYLNAHHIDYRGLIPMGLALEAPENMYDD